MIARVHKRRHRPTRDADHFIETLLTSAARPLSAYDIHDCALAGGEHIPIPRIYRMVARLIEQGKIRRVETLNAYMPAAAGDHAIAICRDCSAVTAVPIGHLEQEIRDILLSKGFSADEIIVETQGLCFSCLGKVPPN